MSSVVNFNRLGISLALFGANAAYAFNSDFIAPPMINIPAGTFMMGSDTGKEAARPRHKVSLDAFQMAKYPITVAEFRKFAEDTGFQREANCNDKLSKTWLSGGEGTASWENNRYQHSEYQPVVCITWYDANTYAEWLSNKTGVDYRLPTEQEWEYATRANTTSRFFWGDDLTVTDSCLYGNFADESSEYMASKQYGASYVGFIDHVKCNDNEPYNSIVGLYRPNPFGLFDMVGNVKQYMGNCFYKENKIYSKEEMYDESCERIAFRGTIWHFSPEPHNSVRGGYRKASTPNAILGFRLAVNGHSSIVDASSVKFEKALKQAQADRIATRAKIPATPTGVQFLAGANQKAHLSWQPSNDPSVVGYDIYQSLNPQSQYLTGFFKNYYKKYKSLPLTTHQIEVNVPEEGASYRVVARNKFEESLPSSPVSTVKPKTLEIPGRLNMVDVADLDNLYLRHRPAKEDRPELYYLLKYTDPDQSISTAFVNVEVKKSAWYQLNYNGKRGGKGEFFNLWRDNQLLGKYDYDKDIDDKSSNRHKVYLEKGRYDLQLSVIRETPDRWYLVWLELTELGS